MAEIEARPVPDYWEKWREEALGSKEMSIALQVIDAMSDGVIITDTHNRILEMNRTMLEISGYEKKELIGESILKLLKIGERFQTLLRLQRTITGEAVKRTESKIITKQKIELPVALNARIVGDEKGEPKFIVFVFKNIIELKRAEEEQHRRLLHTLDFLQKTWKAERRRLGPLPREVTHAQREIFRVLRQQLVSGRRTSGIVEAYKEFFTPLVKKRKAFKRQEKTTRARAKCEKK
jgi:PAS domain S-box-containing protein